MTYRAGRNSSPPYKPKEVGCVDPDLVSEIHAARAIPKQQRKQEVDMLFNRSWMMASCAAIWLLVPMLDSAEAQLPSAPNAQAPAAQYPAATARPAQVPTGRAAAANGRAATNSQAAANGQAAPAANRQATAQQPANPFNLTPAEKARLDQILGFWEKKSSGVKTYSCKFKRWDYSSVFGPPDPKAAATISDGILRYAAPDKGEFKVEEISEYKAGVGGKPPAYPKRKSDHEEHWICDGDSVFELNGKARQLVEEKLPPEMKGNAIADGPLPFVFGAKREKLLARYWMREMVPPEKSKGEYWIDVRPKTREDAANFQRITVILDEKEFLPKAMQIFPPGFSSKNWTRQAYLFTDRDVNNPLQRNQEWLGRFISPRVSAWVGNESCETLVSRCPMGLPGESPAIPCN